MTIRFIAGGIAEPRTWVDVEGALRAFIREKVTSVDSRVFFGTNETVFKNKDTQIVLFRVAGPDDNCLIQCDVWGQTKADAAALAAELATAADSLARYSWEGVLLHSASVDSVRWLPDDAADTPRYIVELTIFATANS